MRLLFPTVIHEFTVPTFKQVENDLIKLDAIKFEKDIKDTRLKHVYLNEKGLKIFDEIFFIQKKRIYKALLNSNSKEVISFSKVLNKIIDE